MIKIYKVNKEIIGLIKYDNNELPFSYYTYIKTEGDRIISIIILLYNKNKFEDVEKIINSKHYEIIIDNNSYKIQDLLTNGIISECTSTLQPKYYKVYNLRDLSHRDIYHMYENDIIKVEGYNVKKITAFTRYGIEYKFNKFILYNDYLKNDFQDVTEQYTRDVKLKKLGIC